VIRDLEVATFYIAEILQTLQKHAGARGCRQWRPRQIADERRFARILGERRKRPCGCGSTDKRDQLPALQGLPLLAEITAYHVLDGSGEARSGVLISYAAPPNSSHD
jgi:hypothetical protein